MLLSPGAVLAAVLPEGRGGDGGGGERSWACVRRVRHSGERGLGQGGLGGAGAGGLPAVLWEGRRDEDEREGALRPLADGQLRGGEDGRVHAAAGHARARLAVDLRAGRAGRRALGGAVRKGVSSQRHGGPTGVRGGAAGEHGRAAGEGVRGVRAVVQERGGGGGEAG